MTFRSLVLSLALLPASALAAQSDAADEAWAQNLTNSEFLAAHPIDVEAFPDGGVLVVTIARRLPTSSSNRPGEVTLTKLDENGDVVWTESVDSPPYTDPFIRGQFADATITDQGEVYFIWSNPNRSYLRRYDASGSVIWERTLLASPGLSGFVAKHVAVTPSGDIVTVNVGIASAYPRLVVRSFAPNAAQLWEWRGQSDPGLPAQADATGVVIGAGGEVYIPGRSDLLGFPSRGMLIALDSVGNLQWRHDAFNAGTFQNAVLDSRGNVVVATTSFGSVLVQKLAPDGSVVFSNDHDEDGFFLTGSTVGIDALDRIYVGGSRWVSGGVVGAASLYRFDAAGAYVGVSQPSVVDPGEDGTLAALHVTESNDVIAFGYSGTGLGEMVAARFAPNGIERWAFERRGRRPLDPPSESVGVDLAVDPRGSLFTLSQIVLDGAYPNATLGADVAKYVQGGPAGTSYCAPAPSNSTGQPATLEALGPALATSNNVTLRVDDLPPSALTLFLASRTQGNAPNAGGGQGTLCLAGAIGRFYGPGQIRTATSEGSAALQLDVLQLPQPTGSVAAVVGETWNFQSWYRDANPTPTSNLSNGVSVVVQ